MLSSDRGSLFSSKLLAVLGVRMRLLLRQRLGMVSIAVGIGLVLLAFALSKVSFLSPQKIFWDFSLAVNFILQVALAVFLGSQLYHEERGRRTLHLILSSGVSRLQWLLGNGLGQWLVISFMGLLWFGVASAVSYLIFGQGFPIVAFQALLLIFVETAIVLFFSMFFSLVVRQMLALSLSALLVVFLHSMNSIQSIFTNPQYGRFIDDNGVSVVMWLGRLLPPLEWLDLKSFVGYEAAVSWSLVGQMSLLGFAWATVFLCFSWLRFERMDL